MSLKLHDIPKAKLRENSHQFKNYIDKGQVIESWMVEKMPDIFKGDAVKAVVKRAKITLTLDARILENGSVGDNVKCKLEKSNKILLGTLMIKKQLLFLVCNLMLATSVFRPTPCGQITSHIHFRQPAGHQCWGFSYGYYFSRINRCPRS